jgi:hypothetical protein
MRTSGDKRKLWPQERMNSAEIKLWNNALDYEDKYFLDMQFKTAKLKKFFAEKILDDSGKWIDVCDDLPGWEHINISDWTIKIVHTASFYGECNKNKKLIKIKSGLSKQEEKHTLLHELIHAYEDMLLLERYKQILCFYFYKKFVPKKFSERKFFELIRMDDFLFRAQPLADSGHSVLFLLKSIDLDLRLKLPRGTIYSYQREKHLNPKSITKRNLSKRDNARKPR